LVDQELVELIQRSRQADRDDIRIKDAICALGIRTTALKGDGFRVFTADGRFCGCDRSGVCTATERASGEWLFHLSGDDVAGQVLAARAQVVTEPAQTYAFISLRAA
jgi:hypothetical protein